MRAFARPQPRSSRLSLAGLLALSAIACAPPGSVSAEQTPRADEPRPRELVRPGPLYDDDHFLVPDEPSRRAAVGSLDGLSPAQQRAFHETPDFRPVSPPQSGDWLAEHRERGQSFEGFQRSAANRPDDGRRTIYVQPLGATEGAPLDALTRFTADYFQLPVKTLPTLSLDALRVTERRNDGVRQLLAPELLTRLAERLPDDAYCLIGVTMTDLYPDPEWNFVFGYASLSERVGVHSFARYDPAFYGREASDAVRDALVLERGAKVMAHEIGHMFGMQHCVYYDCVMNGSNHLDESDSKPMHLCPLCLRKLQTSVGFDPGARYQLLGERYDALGLSREAEWTRRRAEFVTRGALDEPTVTAR